MEASRHQKCRRRKLQRPPQKRNGRTPQTKNAKQTIYYPLLNWERPYRGDICTELNVERYDLRKDGNVGFSHPWGTHDDVFWSIALAVYATADMGPEPFLAVIPRRAKVKIPSISLVEQIFLLILAEKP